MIVNRLLHPTDTAAETISAPPAVLAGYHQPALDGLRGIAILAVMLFHAGHFGNFHPLTRVGRYADMLIGSGWVGVDLFFVLSGFLITGILLRSRQKPGYFRNFYARRVLRIFPLYYSAVLFFILVMPLLPSARQVSSRAAWLAATYTVNLEVGLNGWTAIPGQMQHFWTLAIEEQFYLAWPLLVFLLTRKRMVLLCGTILAAAPLCRWFYLSHHDWLAAFTLTWCRIDALALGGLVSLVVLGGRPVAFSRWIVWGVGAMSTLGLMIEFLRNRGLHFESPTMATVGFSLVAWLSAALIAGLILFPGGRGHRWFSAAPLRFLGKYSYGLYVCHQPAMLALRMGHVDINVLNRFVPHEMLAYLGFAAVSITCSILVALCTWRLIEAPFLRLKRYFEYGAATV